ncbi:hypothetical protein [Methylobacterium sp.]|uniref:hypothetical protein n=1 Tax=Methylobacterium sp. TaxID=409 RepID=UPI000C50C240|nr:hypothetical protein [Methylobacterium sp.]MBP31604.1 hypothetical protein [Methylobacterium sp.]
MMQDRIPRDSVEEDYTMSQGFPLMILAFGTLGGIWFLAAAARKQVADAKGSLERSNLIHQHGGTPRPNMPGTEH